jgi:hypothetical protein
MQNDQQVINEIIGQHLVGRKSKVDLKILTDPSLYYRSKLGSALQAVLSQAKVDGRLTCGLPPTVAHLERASEDVLLCVLPLTRPGDAATHIQTVLLQAFCYENYIPVIQVSITERFTAQRKRL